MRLLVVLLLIGATVHADELVCSRVRDVRQEDGPIVIGLFDADFGTAMSPCLAREFSVAERVGASVDRPGFYGDVRADSILSLRWQLKKRIMLLAAIEAVHYELAVNAVIDGRAIGLGQSTLGLAGQVLETRRFALAVYGRVLVPTSSSSVAVQTTGAELGLSGIFRPRRDVELHAQVDGDFTAALIVSPHPVRGGATLMVGAQYTPTRWFSLAVDVSTVLGHVSALDAFVPALALRFRPYRVSRGISIELAAEAPLFGSDRRLALAALRVGYRF